MIVKPEPGHKVDLRNNNSSMFRTRTGVFVSQENALVYICFIFSDIKFKWTVNSQLERESNQSRNSWKSLPSLRRAKTNQQIQNKPFDKFLAYQREKTLPNLPLKSDLKTSFKIKDSVDAISKCESIADEEILLPTLSSARSLGEAWLLRRPTLIQSEPLTEDETMFQNFTKTIDLKPLNFQNTKDQYIFYSNHYPLILQSQEEEEKLSIQRKRTPTPDPLKDPEERRKITRINRMNYLEDSLDDLERELDDMEFRTVLKDDVFYPQKWPWNKNRDSYHTISSSKLKSPSPNGSNRAKSPVPNIRRSKSPSPVKEVRRLRSPKKERSS